MVHNSKAKQAAFRRLIEAASGLSLGQAPFEMSGVKRDNTVFVRFKSSNVIDAVTLMERVATTLTQQGYDFTQVDDVRIRFPLSAIPG
jgi:hypothetical protein